MAASLILMPMLHLALVGKATYTPGGPVFVFGGLVQDGIAQRWLAEHCPVPGIKLCTLQDRIPKTADDFLWGDASPFQDIGGWSGAADAELGYLVKASIRTYPSAFIWTSLRATGQQMVRVKQETGWTNTSLPCVRFLLNSFPVLPGRSMPPASNRAGSPNRCSMP